MTEQQTPDREKMIAEIKQALEKATPGPWEIVDIGGIEIARDYKYKDGKHSAYWIAEMYQDEDMDEDQVYADAHLIANAPEWLGFLLEERNKLIEGLRTILDYASEDGVHWKLDKCYTTARDILKEIGVTVE